MSDDFSTELNKEMINQVNKKKKIKNDATPRKQCLFFLISGCIALCGGVICLAIGLLNSGQEIKQINYDSIHTEKNNNNDTYSLLSGISISEDQLNMPTYCIQIPNGLDGARPQVGLTEAGVVFEAVAEAGITRFAAIFQNPKSAIIGPIRSLRIYYLEWDTPFDCTIVHAGGSSDALAALTAGGYRDLTEDYTYMYRGTHGNRLWNNLFTTSDYLNQFSSNRGYTSSDVKGFKHMTPEESQKQRIEKLATNKLNITKPTTDNTSAMEAKTTSISLNFGNIPAYNVNYTYDIESNTYRRSYANGSDHNVYKCPDENLGEKNPEDYCELVQMKPSTVVAIVVNERRASDDYHEDISTIGSGDAYIFQNGIAIEGRWQKATKNDQIKFTDNQGNEVALAPGQAFVSAIPDYGSIEY